MQSQLDGAHGFLPFGQRALAPGHFVLQARQLVFMGAAQTRHFSALACASRSAALSSAAARCSSAALCACTLRTSASRLSIRACSCSSRLASVRISFLRPCSVALAVRRLSSSAAVALGKKSLQTADLAVEAHAHPLQFPRRTGHGFRAACFKLSHPPLHFRDGKPWLVAARFRRCATGLIFLVAVLAVA